MVADVGAPRRRVGRGRSTEGDAIAPSGRPTGRPAGDDDRCPAAAAAARLSDRLAAAAKTQADCRRALTNRHDSLAHNRILAMWRNGIRFRWNWCAGYRKRLSSGNRQSFAN